MVCSAQKCSSMGQPASTMMSGLLDSSDKVEALIVIDWGTLLIHRLVGAAGWYSLSKSWTGFYTL